MFPVLPFPNTIAYNQLTQSQKIDIPTETIHLDTTTSATPSTLSTSISKTEPRYAFYRHTSPSTNASSIVFISTCPSGSKVKERMLYAASRNGIIHQVAPEAGITVTKKLEAGDPDEVTEAVVLEEVEGKEKVEVKKGFDRPKRPGRR